MGNLFAIIILKKVADVFGLGPKETRCVESLFLLILISYFPVFGHRLMVMAALAKGLPVRFVPEQFRITAMRCDVINDRCRDETAFCFAADAPGMTFQEELPGLLPFPAVATCLCAGPVALALPFMFLTIFSSIRHQLWASRIFAGRLRSSGHFSSSPASKKDRWHFATVLYPFLGNYIISHRWDCKQEKPTATLCNPADSFLSGQGVPKHLGGSGTHGGAAASFSLQSPASL